MRFSEFDLKGLRLEPGQVWGSVRIAAVIRDEVRGDLRLTPRDHDSSWVRSTYPKTDFFSYMPRAFILSWGKDGQAVATTETHLGKHRPERLGKKRARFSASESGYRRFPGPTLSRPEYRLARLSSGGAPGNVGGANRARFARMVLERFGGGSAHLRVCS